MIDISAVTEQVNTEFLRRHVRSIAGPRHGWNNFERLEESARSIEAALRSCSLHVSSQPVHFHDRAYRNIIADTECPADKGVILIGAHYDSAAGSPGADDNASGVAVMLEAARIIGGMKLPNPVRFTAFTLEEPQPHSVQILIGSKHFSEEAKKAGDKYGWKDIGSSFLPSDLIAAFLFAQLENIEDIQAKRKQIWQLYDDGLKKLEVKGFVKLPYIPEYATNNSHLFYILCENQKIRDGLLSFLKSKQIRAVFHYLPLHKSDFYSETHGDRQLPWCDSYSECLIRLPIYCELSGEKVKEIISCIYKYFECRL